MIGSRQRTVVAIAATAVGSMVFGFLAAGRIQSPSEAAAKATAPEASAITVPVEERELTSRVVTRGDAVFAGAFDVHVEIGALETPPVVTGHVPAAGDTVAEGEPLLEVAGRPVLALAGGLPTYRTLRPGMTGPDVEQLERALVRLGLDTGDATDRRYDAATAAAVAELYARAGYEAPAMSEALAGELAVAQDAAGAAEDALATAQDNLRQARAAPAESARLAAQAQVDQAARSLEQARAEHAAHAGAVARAEDDLEAARSELAAAEDDLQRAREADDAATVETARQRHDAATTAVAQAQAGLADLRSLDTRGQVLAAESQAGIAAANLAELLSPADTTVESGAVGRAEAALAAARDDLALVRAEAGTPAPAAELVFVPTLPRRVDSVQVGRGSLVDGPVMAVSGAELVVLATISDADQSLVAQGMAVTLDTGDVRFEGTVTELRSPEDGGGLEAVVAPTGLAADEVGRLRGRNVRVDIPIEATDGPVLTVPLAALTAGPDGGSRIEVARAHGDTELVEVDVGLAADGHAEIRPLDADVEAGDLVVVGR